MQVADLSGPTALPEVGTGLKAGIAAVNKACEAGRPIELVQCDSKADPNATSACAREAVSKHVVATLGNYSASGSAAMTALFGQKIPSLFNTGLIPIEIQSPLSYPEGNGSVLLNALVDGAAGTGAKSIVGFLPNVGASLAQAVALGKGEATQLGVSWKNPVIVPLDATDYTSYVAQALSAHADAIIVALPSAMLNLFLNALTSSGTDLTKTKVVVAAAGVSSKIVDQLKSKINGLYAFSATTNPADSSAPGAGQYAADLKAAGESGAPTTDGFEMDIAAHAFAKLVKPVPDVTSASLAAAANTYEFNQPGMGVFAFNKPGFPSHPLLSKLRIFDNQAMYFVMKNGKFTPVVSGFVPIGSTPKFTS